jgi:nickel/cobalt transporter (NicO) family protein
MTSSLLSVLLAALLLPAHPFGQNSVDQALRVELARPADGGGIVMTLRLSLDVAEVVTAQVMVQLDRDHDGKVTDEEEAAYRAYMVPRTARELEVRIDGAAAALAPSGFEIGFFAGDEGFPTLRMTLAFTAAIEARLGSDPARVEVRNRCFAHLRGRRRMKASWPPELSLREEPTDEREDDRRRLALVSAATDTAPGRGLSGPDAAAARISTLGAAGVHPLLALLRSPDRSWQAWLWGLALAFALGMLHAFSPGHGKTLAAAFLLGRRARARHALWLGLSVTAAHVVAVFALGLVALTLAARLLVDALAGYVTAASGLALMLIGAWMLFRRLGHDPHHHPDHHHHHHGHERGDHAPHEPHEHPPAAAAPPSLRETLALGFSGGVAPCPTALVILLLAMAVGRVAFGMALIVAFSLGMSLVLVLGGLTVVFVGHELTKRAPRVKGWYPVLARLSAAVIVTVGALIALAGLQQAGVVRLMI